MHKQSLFLDLLEHTHVVMPFQPGNKLSVKNRLVERTLIKIIENDEKVLGDQSRLCRGLNVLLDRFAEGDSFAATFIADRVDGKAKQAIDMQVDMRLSEIGVLAGQKLLDVVEDDK